MFCNLCQAYLFPFAFKVFYIGHYYSGFNRQPHGFAIEDFLESAFISQGYVCTLANHGYRAVSRTDAGVSALANVFFLNLPKDPKIEKINAFLPKNKSILLIAWTKLNTIDDLYPVVRKTYRYFLPKDFLPSDLSPVDFLAFLGTYDFSPFIKFDKKSIQNNVCSIFSVSFLPISEGILFQFVGDHFGWKQIRKMLGFLISKHSSFDFAEKILSEQLKSNFPPLPGHFLSLISIDFSNEPTWHFGKIGKLLQKHIQNVKMKKFKNNWQLYLLSQLFTIYQKF